MDDNQIELPLIDKKRKKSNQNGFTSHENHDIPVVEIPRAKYREITSYFNFFFYLDALPLARFINKTTEKIKIEHLPLPYHSFNFDKKVNMLEQLWQERANSPSKHSLFFYLVKIHTSELIQNFVWFLTYGISSLVCALILGKIMAIMGESVMGAEIDSSSLTYYTIGFIFACFFGLFGGNWWSYLTFQIGASLRLSITGFIYRKLNSVALSSLQEISIGKIINILANDVNDLDWGIIFIAPIMGVPLSLALSLYILWSYFGAFSLISMGLQAVILISAAFFSELSKKPREEKNLATDKRVKYVNEFIENIRLIKLYGWEKHFNSMITDLRNKELTAMKKLSTIDALSMLLTESCTYICIFVTCIFYVANDGVLSPEKVFTSTLVLNFSRLWVNFCIHKGLMFLVSMRMLSKRLEEVLEVKDVIDLQRMFKDQLRNESPTSPAKQEKGAVEFNNFKAYWSPNAETPCLNNINITVQKGELVALIGKIGSGKTTFLLSFLREIPVTSGQLLYNGSFAYVEQEPIVFSGSIRDNILFGKDFDETYYSRVIRACTLDEDFKQLEHGDQTIVGERGVTLSGGQKARVSLGRALYARSDIYLLDDPLSAVDSRVGRLIFERGIKELLKDKTVLLVTHHLSYAKEADRVVIMKDGGIEAEGSFDSLANKKIDLLQIFNEDKEKKKEQKENTEPKPDKSESLIEYRKSTSFFAENTALKAEKQKAPEEELVFVTKETYATYMRESGNYKLAFMVVGSFLMAQTLVLGFTKYLGYWAQLQSEAQFYEENDDMEVELEDIDDGKYIFTILIFALGIPICNFGKTYFGFKFLLETDTKLHQKMLYKISRTFVSFFDSTPIGVILNRFSNDMGVLDKSVFYCIYDVCEQGSATFVFMIYLCFVFPGILIPCVIVAWLLYQVKIFFNKPTMELRMLDLISRSPIYSEISSTLNGLLSIRVYQQGARYIRQFSEITYTSARVYLAYIRNNRLFAITLDTLVNLFTVICILAFMYIVFFSQLDIAIFGQALLYLMLIASDSAWAIRQLIFLDINMQSAERIQQYCMLKEEPPAHIPTADNKLIVPSKTGYWPYDGRVRFNNVYLRYPNTNKCALNGLSFSIEPGCKVGVVGRTGAGKSSIIQALFRIVEIEDVRDSCIEVDGVDIKSIGLETLRRSLSILPQTPVIFSGTIKRNLDPFDEVSERRLWDALEQVKLKEYVEALEKGLETDMSVSSSVFSAGQKQLVCLARVILRKSKVVILDEATANVDMITDNIIQEKINEIFKECVVLTIAHRLITIANYDKILVMDKGMMVEYDHPYKLLVENEGDTEMTKREGVFAGMVKRSGEKLAKEIFEKAHQAYVNKTK